MKTRIQKWGNSLAVRIPKSFATEAHFEKDTTVEVTLRDGELVISTVKSGYMLTDLLDQVTDENKHSEVDYGPAVGAEVW